MLSRRLCSAFVQPLFCKQSMGVRLYPISMMLRPPAVNPIITLNGFRAVRGSNVMYSSAEPASNILKPFLFTIGICSSSLIVASIWRYEKLVKQHNLRKKFGIDRLWQTRQVYVTEWERKKEELLNLWNSLSEGKKLYIGILGANLLVLLAWSVPKFQNVMLRYFTCNIRYTGILCWPLLFATFSHAGILHFGTNMYALHSIIEDAVHKLGVEQFAAFYVSSGVVAAFCSYLWLAVTKSSVSSLGASGAVLAVFGYVCTERSDLRLKIIFLPMIDFDGDTAIKSIVAISLAGVIFRWGVIDHMAHLCGVLCGVAWSRWGSEYIWDQRKPIIDFWQEIRPSILQK